MSNWLKSERAIGDTCVLHVFGYDYWIGNCTIVEISFSESRVNYTLELPNETKSRVQVASHWVVSDHGETNGPAPMSDE